MYATRRVLPVGIGPVALECILAMSAKLYIQRIDPSKTCTLAT